MSKIYIVIFLVLISQIHAQIIVNTQNGPIMGRQQVSDLNTSYFSFQRIPYMKPPVDPKKKK